MAKESTTKLSTYVYCAFMIIFYGVSEGYGEKKENYFGKDNFVCHRILYMSCLVSKIKKYAFI